MKPKTIQELFKYGLDRDIPKLPKAPKGLQLNFGPGDRKIIDDTVGIGLGGELCTVRWEAPHPVPSINGLGGIQEAGTVAAIHMYQFIEHFNGDDVIKILRECERLLMPGGLIYIACPHQMSTMAHQALDHKSVWNEEVWNWMFDNDYYSDHQDEGWKLEVVTCFIMGLVVRNLNLFTVLRKTNQGA